MMDEILDTVENFLEIHPVLNEGGEKENETVFCTEHVLPDDRTRRMFVVIGNETYKVTVERVG